MLIGIVFLLYSMGIVASIMVAWTQTENKLFLIFTQALIFTSWLMLGLIATGIL